MSVESAKFTYRHLPVSQRVGSGSFTYSFIAEMDTTVQRFSIFADNLSMACMYTSLIMGTQPVGFRLLAPETYELQFYGSVFRYYLYLD